MRISLVLVLLLAVLAGTAQASTWQGLPKQGLWKGKASGGDRITFRVNHHGKWAGRMKVSVSYTCKTSAGQPDAGGRLTLRHRGSKAFNSIQLFGPAADGRPEWDVFGTFTDHHPIFPMIRGHVDLIGDDAFQRGDDTCKIGPSNRAHFKVRWRHS